MLALTIVLKQVANGWRWRQILHNLKPARCSRAPAPTCCCRWGSARWCRSWLIARMEDLKMGTVLTTTIIARFVDGVVFALLPGWWRWRARCRRSRATSNSPRRRGRVELRAFRDAPLGDVPLPRAVRPRGALDLPPLRLGGEMVPRERRRPGKRCFGPTFLQASWGAMFGAVWSSDTRRFQSLRMCWSRFSASSCSPGKAGGAPGRSRTRPRSWRRAISMGRASARRHGLTSQQLFT